MLNKSLYKTKFKINSIIKFNIKKKSKFPFELENQEKVWKTIKIVTQYIKMLQLSLHQKFKKKKNDDIFYIFIMYLS